MQVKRSFDREPWVSSIQSVQGQAAGGADDREVRMLKSRAGMPDLGSICDYMEINGQIPRIFPSQANSIPLPRPVFSPDAKRGECATKMLAVNEPRFDCF
jgi:hypothetical protein